MLTIKDLSVSIGDKQILNNLSLTVEAGQTCAIMGPNGSGKSTLTQVIMGHPAYEISSGSIIFKGLDITDKKPEERAALGLFLAMQQPREIAGVDFFAFLYEAYKNLQTARGASILEIFEFQKLFNEAASALDIKEDWSGRYLNLGLSGGEKKKSEMLQMALLNPSLAIFDEIDSGLDVDALKVVGAALKRYKTPDTAALVITHYQRVLQYLAPDKVIVMYNGRVIAEGGHELAKELEASGFEKLITSN
jgi:Fe-S cluster assembly ATP-binding protein